MWCFGFAYDGHELGRVARKMCRRPNEYDRIPGDSSFAVEKVLAAVKSQVARLADRPGRAQFTDTDYGVFARTKDGKPDCDILVVFRKTGYLDDTLQRANFRDERRSYDTRRSFFKRERAEIIAEALRDMGYSFKVNRNREVVCENAQFDGYVVVSFVG